MHVFISYSRVDKSIAQDVARMLATLDISYFLDEKDISWGADFNTMITDAFNRATHVLVIVSPASLKSQWVSYEIGIAKAKGLTVLPFLTHPSLDVPSFIAGINHTTSLDDARAYFVGAQSQAVHAVEEEFRQLCKLIDEYFEKWIEMGYSGRGTSLIPYDRFQRINEVRVRFETIDREKRAFLLRCAVQNGMGGEWGKWLYMNTSNVGIVEPLFVASDGGSGWKPTWRSAHILKMIFGDDIKVALDRLNPDLLERPGLKLVREVASAMQVPDYLRMLVERDDSRGRDALSLLEEFRVFNDDLADYAKQQTVKTIWLHQTFGRRPFQSGTADQISTDEDEWDKLLARPDAKQLLRAITREARKDYLAGQTTGASVRKMETNRKRFRAKLRQNLTDRFSEEDLRTLCFDVGLDYENLPAQGKAGKAREIVAEVERMGSITEFFEQCRVLRPNVPWEDVPEMGNGVSALPGDSLPKRSPTDIASTKDG